MALEIEVNTECVRCRTQMKVPRGLQVNLPRLCPACVKKEYEIGIKINSPVVVTENKKVGSLSEDEEVPYINKRKVIKSDGSSRDKS